MEKVINIINQILKNNGLSCKMNKTTAKNPEYRFFINEQNKRGETVGFILSKCENPGGKNSLPALWYKKGYTKKILETHWAFDSFITNYEGHVWRRAYNPRINDNYKLNFDYMLEATPENAEIIVKEMIRRFLAA